MPFNGPSRDASEPISELLARAPDFSRGLNRFQQELVCEVANELPDLSGDLSEFDLLRHTLVASLIDSEGNPEVARNVRHANIIQGRFKLLIEMDTTKAVTVDHYTRLEYYAKEVWREVGKTEDEIREIFAEDCGCNGRADA